MKTRRRITRYGHCRCYEVEIRILPRTDKDREKARRYRERAKECRIIAATMTASDAQAAILQVAASYDSLAENFEDEPLN